MIQKQKETPCQILFHGIHGSRGVHNAEHYRIGLRARFGIHMFKYHVVLMIGKTRLLVPHYTATTCTALCRILSADTIECRTLFIKTYPNTGLAVSFALAHPISHNLAQNLSLHIGEFEIFKYKVQNLLKRHIRLIIINARLIPRLVFSCSLCLTISLANYLTRLGITIALPYPRRIVSIDKPILFDATNRHLDNLFTVTADDRLIIENLMQIVLDRPSDFFPMPSSVASASITSQSFIFCILTENSGLHIYLIFSFQAYTSSIFLS